MKFSGKMWLDMKSHKKKTMLHSEKIWGKRTRSGISEFSILGIG